MRLTHDATHDVAYLELVAVDPGAVVTTHALAAWLAADFDAAGHLVGLEVLDASDHLPAAALQQAEAPTEWLTLAEAGALIDRSPTTLRVQIRNGRLPAKKQGRDWVVRRAALETYAINAGAEPPPAPPASVGRTRASEGPTAKKGATGTVPGDRLVHRDRVTTVVERAMTTKPVTQRTASEARLHQRRASTKTHVAKPAAAKRGRDVR